MFYHQHYNRTTSKNAYQLLFAAIICCIICSLLLEIYVTNHSSSSNRNHGDAENLGYIQQTSTFQRINFTHLREMTPFKKWIAEERNFCEGNFKTYSGMIGTLKNVVIDPDKFLSERKGGEDLQDVVGQLESKEYYSLNKGAFEINCLNKPISHTFLGVKDKPNSLFYNVVSFTSELSITQVNLYQDDFTVALVRYDYVNFYHTVEDWYGIFILQNFLNKTKTNVLLVDSHPTGNLDATWNVLFPHVYRISNLKRKVLFKDMAWSITRGPYNPLVWRSKSSQVPLLEEFRTWFLMQHLIDIDRQLRCDHITILFIWRRDYVSHPRQVAGHFERKISNEDELLEQIGNTLPNISVQGIQLDKLTMKMQLEIVSKTDILIAMHGAGLTHLLFLANSSAVIELFPMYRTDDNEHFSYLAKHKGIIYQNWTNYYMENEFDDFYTYVPPSDIISLINQTLHKIGCT